MSDLKFRFNGKDIQLPNANQLLQISVDALNKDFVSVMAKTIGKLNEIIQKMLIEVLGDSGKNRLVLTYEPTEGDPFGIIWIEYFVCETFNLEFEYMFAKDSQSYNLIWRYTNEKDETGKPFNGTITTDPEMKTNKMVPAFDCRERNQCNGGEYVKLCTETNTKAEFKINQLDNNVFNVASTIKNKTLVAWVWDIVNTSAKEPFYTGESLDMIIPKPTGAVRLTVISEKGCFAFTENPILK
jgi:hypothetical protein